MSTKRGSLQAAIIQALKEAGHPIPFNSIWFRVQKSAPQSLRNSVQQAVYDLVRSNRIISLGDSRTDRAYALPKDKPMSANGTPSSPVTIPPAVAPVAPELPRAVKAGQFTINTSGWIAADDHGDRIELFLNVLEIDPTTKHARTKRLTFDQPNEVRSLRAWLAQQSGPHTIGASAALEAERDTALELAQAAEERARQAEAQLQAIKAALR